MLVIGCGNVSILLLARGTARQQELAGPVGRSVPNAFAFCGSYFTEALNAVRLPGAVRGAGVRLVKVIVKWLPEFSFPHEAALSINLPVLLFSVVLALADRHPSSASRQLCNPRARMWAPGDAIEHARMTAGVPRPAGLTVS